MAFEMERQLAGFSLRLRVGLSVVLLCVAGALSSAPSAAPDADLPPDQRFQLALEAQSARDYRAMLGLLRQAATDGSGEAQEMLGMVLLAGPTVYGAALKADRCEARQWMRRAAMQGSATAKLQLDFLNRVRRAPAGGAACD